MNESGKLELALSRPPPRAAAATPTPTLESQGAESGGRRRALKCSLDQETGDLHVQSGPCRLRLWPWAEAPDPQAAAQASAPHLREQWVQQR